MYFRIFINNFIFNFSFCKQADEGKSNNFVMTGDSVVFKAGSIPQNAGLFLRGIKCKTIFDCLIFHNFEIL